MDKKSLKVTEKIIFDGYKGWVNNGITYRLACGPWIVQAPNGDLLCNWLTGSDNEPSTDNCTVMIRSTDNGKTWSAPEMLVPTSEKGNGSAWIFNIGESLVMFAATWPLEYKYTVWNFERKESFDNGKTWGEAKPVQIIDKEGYSAVLSQLIRKADGQNLFCIGTFLQRKEHLKASVESLVHAKSEEEAENMPPMKAGETYPTVFARCKHGCAAAITNDKLNSFQVLGVVDNRPLGLIEPSIIELKSGRLVMLMRAEWGGFLWRSDSDDGGKTWCDAYCTDIPNPSTMAKLIRVPDGRIVLIHNNSCGVVGQKPKNRDPLSIWVSNDEMESWYIKEDIATGGSLAYPHPMIRDDGKLVFVYDFDRRTVRYVEVEFPEV